MVYPANVDPFPEGVVAAAALLTATHRRMRKAIILKPAGNFKPRNGPRRPAVIDFDSHCR
jgi:hypothetical protein